MQTLLQDIRYGIRMLGKNLGFTLIAVFTLALGIGANTAIFSVVNAELLRPLPFRNPDQLVRVWTTNSRAGTKSGAISYPDFADWRSQNKVFEKMTAYTDASFTLTGIEQPAHLQGEMVSAETFEMLGVAPELGRTFLPGEDEAHHHVVVLSHQVWKERFRGDPGVIGRTITLDSSGFTVVGVMPASFNFPMQRVPAAVWVTFSTMQESSDNSPTMLQERGAHFLLAMARLKPGVSLAQAQAGMDVISSGLAKQYPDTDTFFGVRLVSEQAEITSAIRPALFVLLVAVGFVLLIACVNVANLLLARATTRAREIAIRAALGAGRNRVVRQLLTESFLLAFLGGLLGLIIAMWGSEILVRMSPDSLPRAAEIHMDGWVLAFTVAASLVTGILFGLAPALQIARSNLVDTLKEGSLSTTAGGHRHRLRSSLVIMEMALALVLLVSAGLLIRSLVRLQSVNPGFDPQHVMASNVDLPDQKFPDAKKAEFFRQLIPQLRALPGVQSAAAIFPLPMGGDEMRTSLEIEGRPVAKRDMAHTSIRVITPAYFETMRIPLLQGRAFSDRGDANATQTIIVNEALARRYFPNENPVGKHVRPGISLGAGPGPMREIVGVVGNVRFKDLTTEWYPESYIPYAQLPFGEATIVVRTVNDPKTLAKPIADTVRKFDSDMPTYAIKTVEDYLNSTIAIPRFNAVLLGVFAGVALLLTAVGLYGVISYSVAQRTHEIGIRMALGAQPADMLRLVVGQGFRLALVGVGLGLAAAFGLTRFLSSMLFGVASTDPVSFIGVAIVLLSVVFLACFVPARRAMRVDPMVALRYELGPP
ncbi:MAG: ABC transporter permease [Candidatus Acidiferrales bacterium]